MNETLVAQVAKAFEKRFGDLAGAKAYFAPGRVNLIGEHIDYSGGYVFPCALTIGTYAIVKPRTDRTIRLFSVNLPLSGVRTFAVDDLAPLKDKGWEAYVKGVIWALAEKGFRAPCGFDAAIGGDIPGGAGLSSSASLEVLTGFFLRDIYHWDTKHLTNVDIALSGRKCENGYCGVNTGIMDQFASAMGKKDSAIYLNTSSLEYDYAPITMQGRKIVVTNSNKPHSLVSSKYNERRAQSDKARDLLKTAAPDIENLCDLSLERFYSLAGVIKDPVVFKRAKHAVSENERVKESLIALKAGRLYRFGDLIDASGESLRYDYEATCRETDVLVDAARIQPGVLCSRQTGGGWGGCTVSIVDEAYVSAFERNVGVIYSEETSYKATFIVVSVGEGPSTVKSC